MKVLRAPLFSFSAFNLCALKRKMQFARFANPPDNATVRGVQRESEETKVNEMQTSVESDEFAQSATGR